MGIKPLAVTYSCMQVHTTIGAAAFHFRVRDGIGWDHSAMAAREGVEAAQRRLLQGLEAFLKSPPGKAGFALREKDFA